MSFIAMAKSTGSKAVRHQGAPGYLFNKVERYGFAYLFGLHKGYHREKAGVHFRGYFLPHDLLAGLVLTSAEALLQFKSRGRSVLGRHAGAAGDAGMMSFFNSLGAHRGTKWAGRHVLVSAPNSALPAQLPAGYRESLEGLPAAEGTGYLTPEQMANYLSPR